MEETRNILLNLYHLKNKLNGEEANKENIDFYLGQTVERIKIQIEREEEEAKRKLDKIEELKMLLDYFKKGE